MACLFVCFTCDIVAKDPGCDDGAAGREQLFQVGLGQVLGQARDVEVGTFYCFTARSRIRNLFKDKIIDFYY